MLDRKSKISLDNWDSKYFISLIIMPNLYIIAGCNGAGKTTASFTVLPEMLNCDEFLNADEMARGLSPFNPDRAAIDAGRLMLFKIDDYCRNNRILLLRQP
jgi:predicted ABC-type ATPase